MLLKMGDWHENFGSTVWIFPVRFLNIRLCWNKSTENNQN